MQGAHTLAEVLEENETLTEIHCANNEINLQSFTVLVNALEGNRTLLYMPTLEHDRQASIEKVKKELMGEWGGEEGDSSFAKGGALKRTFTGAMSGVGGKRHSLRHTSALPPAAGTPSAEQDVKVALLALNERWDHEVARMQRYLTRNWKLSKGLVWDEDEQADGRGRRPGRPATADSIGSLMEKVKLDRTPTMEGEEEVELVVDNGELGEKRTAAAFTLGEE
jgi:hypothetical protein